MKVNRFILGDCMEYMRQMPDNFADLAIVDPPYGIGRDGGETGKNWKYYKKKGWDEKRPTKEYFNELFRISKNQMIFGANYFTKYLPVSMGWVFWDKGQDLTMSDGELIFTSFQKALRRIIINRCEIRNNGGLIHPTQKPVRLYKWLLRNYATPDMKIIDTHVGSGSSIIAFEDFGCEYIGFEIDRDYFEAAQKRITHHLSQTKLEL